MPVSCFSVKHPLIALRAGNKASSVFLTALNVSPKSPYLLFACSVCSHRWVVNFMRTETWSDLLATLHYPNTWNSTCHLENVCWMNVGVNEWFWWVSQDLHSPLKNSHCSHLKLVLPKRHLLDLTTLCVSGFFFLNSSSIFQFCYLIMTHVCSLGAVQGAETFLK